MTATGSVDKTSLALSTQRGAESCLTRSPAQASLRHSAASRLHRRRHRHLSRLTGQQQNGIVMARRVGLSECCRQSTWHTRSRVAG